MPKSPRKQVSKTRAASDGAQQYVRGKDATDRVMTAGKAVMSTKDNKAKQMLLRAQKAEMGGKARASLSQAKEMEKLRALARGRSRAATNASIKGPNAAAKSAYNRSK